MAKITAPLMSLHARGSIGHGLTFSIRKSGQQVRWQKRQKKSRPTPAQANQRTLYLITLAHWLALSDAEKAEYNAKAAQEKVKLSGWNLFLQRALLSPIAYLGLAACYPMNERSLTSVADLSKNDRTASFSPNYPSHTFTYEPGQNNKLPWSIQGNSQNNHIYAPVVPYLQLGYTNNISVVVWINHPTTNVTSWGESIASTYISTPMRGFRFYLRGINDPAHINRLTLDVGQGDSYGFAYYPMGSLADDRWHCVGFSWDRQSFRRMFKDGNRIVNITSALPDWDNTSSSYIRFAGGGALNTFIGRLSNILVYNRALTDTEMYYLYRVFI